VIAPPVTEVRRACSVKALDGPLCIAKFNTKRLPLIEANTLCIYNQSKALQQLYALATTAQFP
jgi:hypothetical protein